MIDAEKSFHIYISDFDGNFRGKFLQNILKQIVPGRNFVEKLQLKILEEDL